MKIKEMIETVISKGKTEDMLKLNDMLNELICDLKVENPKLYREYKKELYETAYGKVIMEDKAIEIVEEMRPFGEKWDMEAIEKVSANNMIKGNKSDVYLVMNSLYNDYYDVFGEDTDIYVKMTKSWLDDKDAVEDKVYEYFMNIPKKD